MSLDVEILNDTATLRVEPMYGKTVVFDVRYRVATYTSRNYPYARHQKRWVVGLANSTGPGLTYHSTFENACHAALVRARKYEKAFSINRKKEQ